MNKNVIAGGVAGVALCMLGAAFASKPLYDTFCRVTGFGGTTRDATSAPEVVLNRDMIIRFDTNIIDVPFKFRPVEKLTSTKVGATNVVYFEVENTSDRVVKAVASYNVTPHKAGPYFTKLECFCYDEMSFNPGEKVTLPVAFFVNPLIDEESQLDDVTTITLSYTYFRAKDDKDTLASLPDLVSEH